MPVSPLPAPIDWVMIVALGLCLGSFFNVCIWRWPRNKSVVRPASACPRCETPIKWFDNIPILSYLALRGKCRSCGERIAWRYPAVELLTAAIFAFCYWQDGWSLTLLKHLFFFSTCLVISVIDIDFRAIPGWICIAGMLVGIFVQGFEAIFVQKADIFVLPVREWPFVKAVYHAVMAMGIGYFMKLMGDFGLWIYLSLVKRENIEGETEALGLGDVDFLGMLGAFAGWHAAVLTFFLAPFAALGFGIYAMVKKQSHLIAYLPYLCSASFVAVFWGDTILSFLFGG
jgi:leader peptidase (prepilin peptidase)/N-methyltransferase